MSITSRKEVIDLLNSRAALKQDIADYSLEVMSLFKEEVVYELGKLRKSISDKRIRLEIKDKNEYEFLVSTGSDTLVFQLHRNVFCLPDEDPIWESDYMKKDRNNGYFGIINIYNFLAESFDNNRMNDSGYLIARVFMNHNQDFAIEGRGRLGELFQNLPENKITKKSVCEIIRLAFIDSIEFDLITPPFEIVEEVSVMQIQAISSNLHVATGKRLGFKFEADNDVF